MPHSRQIAAITLTYSNRREMLETVLRQLLQTTAIAHVILVDNGCDYNIAQAVKELNGHGRLTLLQLGENTGSANGYKAGLDFFLKQTQFPFAWLLDDDNLPDGDAARVLLETWDGLQAADPTDISGKTALLSKRDDRTNMLCIAQGEKPDFCLGSNNAWWGYDLQNAVKKRLRKPQPNQKLAEKAAVPYAYYSGLLLHRKLLGGIGLPDERFFLYSDDYEFSHRITKSGGTIWLVTGSNLRDLEKSWAKANAPTRKPHQSSALEDGGMRSYYTIRNGIYFRKNHLCDRPLVFRLNVAGFLAGQLAKAAASGKWQAYRIVLRAVADGWHGRLGRVQI